MPSEKTRAKAIDSLEGMKEIVKAEMLIRSHYVDPEHVDQERKEAGAICGGHKACAIGSLWLAYGIKPDYQPPPTTLSGKGTWTLPGTDELFSVKGQRRAEFLRNRPGLKLALNALDDAAERWYERHAGEYELSECHEFQSMIERVFEGDLGLPFAPDEYYSRPEDRKTSRKHMLSIINSAIRQVRTAS